LDGGEVSGEGDIAEHTLVPEDSVRVGSGSGRFCTTQKGSPHVEDRGKGRDLGANFPSLAEVLRP
jgi:hypothetical protein